ncbi:MAG: LiaI-LiaF-like domain-containing protein [Anaerolineae bacterium]
MENIEEKRNRPSIIGPLLLIAAGVLLLLNQMGKLPWGIWGTIWCFWPVILILIGLEILIGLSRSTVIYIIGLLIALAILGAVIAYAVLEGEQPAVTRPAVRTETISELTQDADTGYITLKFAAGRVTVGALSDSPNFVEGKLEYARYSLQAEKDFRIQNGRAEFSLSARSQPIPFWIPGDTAGEYWTLNFTPRIPLQMDIKTGVSKVDLDLSGLKVTQLAMDAGVGEVWIAFPAAAGLTRASINAGVGAITVQIPKDVGARILVAKGLGSVRLESARFTHFGNEYTSLNYNTAENRLDLEIKGGVGAITIK